MIRKEKVINIIPELYTSLATAGCGNVFHSGPQSVIEYLHHQNFILTWLDRVVTHQNILADSRVTGIASFTWSSKQC